MRTAFWLAGATALALTSPVAAADTIKIGFVSTFSGPTAAIGNDMRNSFELALDHLGRKMGGKPVEVIYEDDGQKPDVGKQKTEKLVQSDKVDFIAGYIWSNVLLASLKTAVDSQTFLISANAGPNQLAGELCSPYVFSTSWQNDQTPQAMGLYMNQKGVKSVFLIGPNYAAGKDMLAGVKSTFKGQVVGEEYTVWPTQLDFSAELTKAKASGAESIFVFYPGAAGVQFLNQYVQAGIKQQIPSIRLSPSTNCRCRCKRKTRSGCPARRNGSTTCRTSRTRSSSRTITRNIRDCAPLITARRPMTPRNSSIARWSRLAAIPPRRTP